LATDATETNGNSTETASTPSTPNWGGIHVVSEAVPSDPWLTSHADVPSPRGTRFRYR
jgi:hypothetical protein